jgi:hypothetical protein
MLWPGFFVRAGTESGLSSTIEAPVDEKYALVLIVAPLQNIKFYITIIQVLTEASSVSFQLVLR